MKLNENKDYQFIPVDRNGQESWDIRILEGDFTETVFYFDKLQVTEDGDHLSFNFKIVSTPDPDLTVDNKDLQQYAGMILYDILENSTSGDSKHK